MYSSPVNCGCGCQEVCDTNPLRAKKQGHMPCNISTVWNCIFKLPVSLTDTMELGIFKCVIAKGCMHPGNKFLYPPALCDSMSCQIFKTVPFSCTEDERRGSRWHCPPACISGCNSRLDVWPNQYSETSICPGLLLLYLCPPGLLKLFCRQPCAAGSYRRQGLSQNSTGNVMPRRAATDTLICHWW